MKEFKAKQVISGTWGQLWYDGEYMAEIVSGKAEITYKKTAVQQACKLTEGQKITGLEQIIMKVSDPDSVGGEKIALTGCVLDKMILADFETNKLGERSYGFTFENWDIMESI